MEQIKKLSKIVQEITALGQSFTDIHIESDQPIMLRIAFGEWRQYKGENGDPVVAHHAAILAFINGIYNNKEDLGNPKENASNSTWGKALSQQGSLHPAMTITFDDNGATNVVRLRCTIQLQGMGESIAIMIRPLPDVPSSVEELGLPAQVHQLVGAATNGLIVVTGPTGSGKSTTIAAIVEAINRTKPVNILTIEEPIEYVYNRKKAIINQRELYIDCPTYKQGVRDALRFVPEVIVVGEIRDKETMEATLRAAESGHLVLTTTHSATTVGAIRKMISLLGGGSADSQVLVNSLVAIIAQALLKREPGKDDTPVIRSNVLAYEYLNCKDKNVSMSLQEAWRDETGLNKLEEILRSGGISSSRSMTTVLKRLVETGVVDKKNALTVCPYVEDKSSFLNM